MDRNGWAPLTSRRQSKQNRPRIFDLDIKKPDLLYEKVIEVDERVRLAGQVPPDDASPVAKGLTGEKVEILKAPDLKKLRRELGKLLEEGFESLAIVLLHAFTYPVHELLVGALAEEMGFTQISLSSQVMPRIKMVDRGQTCCVDAYLTPAHPVLQKFYGYLPKERRHSGRGFRRVV